MAKQQDGLSPRYIYALRSDLTRVKNAFQNITSITSGLIEDWLLAQGSVRKSVTIYALPLLRSLILRGRAAISQGNPPKWMMCAV